MNDPRRYSWGRSRGLDLFSPSSSRMDRAIPRAVFDIAPPQAPPEEPTLSIQPIIVSDGIPIGGVVMEFETVGAEGPFTYSLVGIHDGSFSISNNQLLVNSVLTVGEIPIVVRATKGSLLVDQAFTIVVLSVAASWVPGIRPFSVVSPINLPIPAGTNYWRVPMAAATGSNYYSSPKFYIDVPAADETTVCSFHANTGWGFPSATINRIMTPGFNGNRLLYDAGDSDNEAISVNGTDVMSIWQFIRTSDTTGTANQRAQCDVFSTGVGTRSPFLGCGVIADGVSNLGSCLLKEELTRYGAFNHQIGICGLGDYVNFSAAGIGFPPAINNDGPSSNGIGIEGQIFAIKPGTTKPSGLSVAGEAIWQAGIDYGFRLMDVGGSFLWYLGHVYDKDAPVNHTSLNSWSGPEVVALRADALKILPLIQRTGFPLDGLQYVMGLHEVCGPQTQILGTSTSNLMRVDRDSDSAHTDILAASTVTGVINSTAISNFCSGTTGRLEVFYGQYKGYYFIASGSGRPVIYESGALKTINGLPAPYFDGVSNFMTNIRDIYTDIPETFHAVVQVADRAADYGIFGTDAVGGFECRINATTGYPQMMTNDGTVIATSTVAVPTTTPSYVRFFYRRSTGLFEIRVDGVSGGTGTNLVTLAPGALLLGKGGPSSDYFKGYIGATVISLFSGGGSRILTQMENYHRDFWGTP